MSLAWTRISIGAALITGTLALLAADVAIDERLGAAVSPCFWLLLLAVLALAAWETGRMLRLKGHPCRPGVATAFTAILVACAWAEVTDRASGGASAGPVSLARWSHVAGLNAYVMALALLVLLVYTLEVVAVERPGLVGTKPRSAGATPGGDMGRAATSAAWTILTVLSVGLLGTFLARVRFFPGPYGWSGLAYLLLVLGTVKVGDIGAWAIGSTLGRHALVPTLSPKKTWEGLGGGMAGGVAAALAIGCGWLGFSWGAMALFGLAVSAAGVLGDLGESLIKRACGVKDSGPIPGFGGALDILDSLLGAAPVAYFALVLLTGEAQ